MGVKPAGVAMVCVDVVVTVVVLVDVAVMRAVLVDTNVLVTGGVSFYGEGR